ncbi:ion transporter [Pseudohalocynthiibacter aestuariivivens]|jgi:voltage-gated sodium channel|uniref:Ion transporter n=1 Tax=Pseudohalocynthiibacter aestuariivivens TaxID=1591409 RepID=A0ABV5JAA0_9RHOB|nr:MULTISPECIES: ion transporter [Pseudohalocynthiibacter]MBS9716060.1 ion transporter [Pseudohalocynthiibacter aestuariivivens]MCK0102383.1 ion transporter [Pseudohalocynthiibacter sp. F2068]
MINTERLRRFLEAKSTTRFILGVILFNAVLLGMETSQTIMGHFGPAILFLDNLCLTIFTVEIALKLAAYRLSFAKSGWNLFDLAIVVVSLVPVGQGFTVLRALRILRLLRVISVSPSLRKVVEGFVAALPGMGSVVILMSMIFYISAVMATKLFGIAKPEFFGTLGASAYSLFQIMTLESWSMGIVRPVMAVQPYAWVFFVPFILITTFSIVNLLVGLIVNSMQDVSNRSAVDETTHHRDEVLVRLTKIEDALSKLSRADRSLGK